jgi:hypothetical protein
LGTEGEDYHSEGLMGVQGVFDGRMCGGVWRFQR